MSLHTGRKLRKSSPQIPVIFDDIRDMVNEYLDDDQGLMNGLVATDCVNIGLRYFRKPTIKE